jgi:uncharacterized protein (UPF0333 family)
MKKAQIAIEYLFLVAFSVTFFIVLMYGLLQVSSSKTTEKSFAELDDFARSIQQEIILAATVQNGYERTIVVPSTFNNKAFSVTILNETRNDMLLEFSLEGNTFYYRIPDVQGTISSGTVQIEKKNDVVMLS